MNVNGNIGKHIVGRPKLCDTVQNTSTKRCILRRRCTPHPTKYKSKKTPKSNMIRKNKTRHKTPHKTRHEAQHRKIQKDKKSKKYVNQQIIPLCLPKKFEDLAEKCACNKTWVKHTKLGSGAYGIVHRACKNGMCDYAIKKQKYDAQGKAEVQAYLSINKLKIAPKLFAAWVCRGQLYIVIEKLVKCKQNPEQLKPRVRKLLDILERHGWLHVDLHQGNVMCTEKGRTVLIDFGWAVEKGKAPYANHKGKTYATLKQIQKDNFDEFADCTTT